MKRIAPLAALLAAGCVTVNQGAPPGGPGGPLLGNYLPSNKTDLRPLPPLADPTRYMAAADFNALKNGIIAAPYQGLSLQAADPVPSDAQPYWWAKTNFQF